jgi:phage baseplate assembly protein W
MGRQVMAEITISLPFRVDPYGKIAVSSDQQKIWADRVRSVLGTALRERVMQPLFGTEIPSSVFNTQEDAAILIERETQSAFELQLPLLNLQAVTTTFDEFTGIINVSTVYDLPNNTQVETVIGVAYIQGTNPIYQETL